MSLGRTCSVAAVLAAVLGAGSALAQTSPQAEQFKAALEAAQGPLPRRIVAAEDARQLTPATLALLAEGMKSADAAVRAQAVRSAGRFETPSLLNDVMQLLTDRDAAVRRWAAISTANSARLFTQPALDELLRLMPVASPEAWADYAAAVGRITLPSPAEMTRVEQALAAKLPPVANRPPALPARAGASRAATPVEIEGAARGLESLTRINGRVAPLGDDARSRLYLVVESATGPQATRLARARRLALQALRNARAVDGGLARTAVRDRDDEVRRLAVVAAAAAPPTEGQGIAIADADREFVLTAGLKDAEPRVRYEAVRGWGRHLQVRDCQPVLRAVDDMSLHVALAAIDLLGDGCGATPVVPALLKQADTLPATGGAWHRAAHAVVALAKASPGDVRTLLPRFVGHDQWQVRVYAAHAAGRTSAIEPLVRLGSDANDGVRAAALEELVRLKRAEALPVAYDGLNRADYHLVMTSARALAADADKAKATKALTSTMLRLTLSGRDTSRDPRVAILETLAATAAAGDGDAIAAYLGDWDAKVAQTAAETLAKVTGQTRPAASVLKPLLPPDFDVLDTTKGHVLRITMASGGVMFLRLLPDVAPATVARVVSLAGKRYYDGLTFHRVEPTFVLQGGSPGANEYMGDGPFMRDEPGVAHTRGTVGISTRGRDTGDAQLFINLVDSPRLDHAYTVFAVVERGMDVADKVVEGDVMARVELVDAPVK